MKHLDRMEVPYHVIVEEQEFDEYAKVIDPLCLLILDPNYQRDYDTCDQLGDSRSKGSGSARNFAWDHSIEQGHKFHWIMDDNIKGFYRLNKNLLVRIANGAGFRAMEDFVLRYTNVAMAGPQYYMFAPRKQKMPPFICNTRIYSCNLIRNDVPFRWRGRYNEDTDLSLRMLKAGYCTILFNAFIQDKITTQHLPGGNTEDVYGDGTLMKSIMQVRNHPDVSELAWRFGRIHHLVDYTGFKNNKLIRRKRLKIPKGNDEYGMELVTIK
jgi:hypothetical protein